MGHKSHSGYFSVISLSGTQIYLGTKEEEASLLVPTELGEGVGSLLEQDSKPKCQVVPFTSLCKGTLLAAGRRRGLWFQSTFVMWRPPQGVKREWCDDMSCTNFVEHAG